MTKQIITLILVFSTISISSQDYKFGKVTKAELEETSYAKDSSAVASVLYRDVRIHYIYLQESGFQVVKEVKERVKLYDKKGFDYATVSEKLYQGRSESESFAALKAHTYNLEDGEIVKTKLKNADTFTEELSKYYKEKKFTMPDIKEGSVIEYQYKVTSPFSYSIDEIELQYGIPIKEQEIEVAIPEYYSFKINVKGYLNVIPKKTTSTDKITFNTSSRTTRLGGQTNTSYNRSAVDYRTNIDKYHMQDVPALKEEPFINNIDNYRSGVNYEIQYVAFPNSIGKSYATNWEAVSKTIYESANFGEQLKAKNYFKKDLEALLQNVTTDQEKTVAIFSFVQNRMNWNEYRGKYTDEGVKVAYKKKSGNVAEINLILVAMLRESGLKASPVLISTRDNGIPLFPTSEGFNYVVASVEIGGQDVLMDACNKYAEPNLLPTQALNWFGRKIGKDGSSSSIDIMPKKMAKKETFLNVKLDENGAIQGKQRERYSAHHAYLFRNKYNALNEEDYLDKKENANNGIEISNYEIKNKKTIGKPIIESFDFELESQADVIGDKMYVSPLFFHAEDENIFKQEERRHPIDFVFPWGEKYIVSIAIPENYEITSIPENMKMALPNNMGSFSYQIKGDNNKLQVLADVKFNQAIFPASDYFVVKELFKNIVEKETEQIVLSKI